MHFAIKRVFTYDANVIYMKLQRSIGAVGFSIHKIFRYELIFKKVSRIWVMVLRSIVPQLKQNLMIHLNYL